MDAYDVREDVAHIASVRDDFVNKCTPDADKEVDTIGMCGEVADRCVHDDGDDRCCRR